MSNPLLAEDGLPAFDAIRPQHTEPAVRAQLEDNRRRLRELLGSNAQTFAALVEPIEVLHHRLNRTWSPVSHLNAVKNCEPLRRAYNTCLPLISEYQTELGQNEALQRAYALILERERGSLDAEQRKLLENALRDFRLVGVALDRERKEHFKDLLQKLAREQAKFEENVLDSANAWTRTITDAQLLAGLPQPVLARAEAMAREQGIQGWLLTLDQPTFLAVLKHAEHAELRRAFYEAWNTRASDRFPLGGRWDNAAVIENILRWRHEAARLLDFTHYTAYSLATKMARSAEEVRNFLESLAEHCVPVARRELAELEAFAGRKLGAWDVPFHAERLQRHLFAISDQELRPYFPLPRVLQGLFRVTARLYVLSMSERHDVRAWDPNVRYFDIRDVHGELVGGFYLDAYARAHKRSGAWMDECLGRLELGHRRVLPVAYLVCNFLPPVGSQAALLTHEEVITLFHEFGHGLHHLLTRIEDLGVSGIAGVEWDAVELPSQFMENFCWEWDVLAYMSAHVDSGAPLPRSLFEKMVAAKNFQSGMQTVRQLEYALFDMRLHDDFDVGGAHSPLALLDEVRAQVAVSLPPAYNRFPNTFSHIFAGGYGAGYYSYKWAEVLSADAYSLFEENGVLDPATGARFRAEVLAVGGSRPAIESFTAFRGRGPTVDALLRHSGMTGEVTAA